ncbi:ABC transporter permease [Plantactinospora sp. S1510]|uniref:ABC transporter permease n=1 Tax=Plantactinospora alkalitolerans TaxID=2789879 RepID=A0ABS0GTD3_9ACTN|nr:ABC transporter permease [Plantactinospora alkalitolerans]MBF9129314.1 ABC transporter permease [Plantactinospora alkalitolerans]
MTTPTLNSAYPRSVEALVPAARDLAEQTGELPSRNRLMKEFKVGSPKARAILSALRQPHPTAPPATSDASGETSQTQPETGTDPGSATTPDVAPPAEKPVTEGTAPESSPLPIPPADPGANVTPEPVRKPRPAVRSWVLLLLAAPAFVAIWSGWVGLGGLTGFGVVHPLPGIWDSLSINTAITLPIGVEAYAAYALRAWLSGDAVPVRARRFARVSGIGSLMLGALGQIAYHQMTAAGMTSAPAWITTVVACLPVAVLGMGAALAHLLHTNDQP